MLTSLLFGAFFGLVHGFGFWAALRMVRPCPDVESALSVPRAPRIPQEFVSGEWRAS